MKTYEKVILIFFLTFIIFLLLKPSQKNIEKINYYEIESLHKKIDSVNFILHNLEKDVNKKDTLIINQTKIINHYEKKIENINIDSDSVYIYFKNLFTISNPK